MTMSLLKTARQRRLIALASLAPGGENVLSFAQARAKMRPDVTLLKAPQREETEVLNLFVA